MSGPNQRAYELAEEQLARDYEEGRLTLAEYNAEMRAEARAYREAAEEAAWDAYDRERSMW